MRLDAEEVRASLLADAQLLDKSPGGAHPFPPESEWNWEEQNPFTPKLANYENDRRTVYMMVQRSVKHPYMTLFDGADANASTAERNSSLTPLQALYFLNASFPKRCSDHLAELLDEGKASGGVKTEQVSATSGGGSDEKSELDRAFLIVYGRLPDKAEQEQSLQFVGDVSAKYLTSGADPAKARQQAMSHLIQAMFSSNEFMFIE